MIVNITIAITITITISTIRQVVPPHSSSERRVRGRGPRTCSRERMAGPEAEW